MKRFSLLSIPFLLLAACSSPSTDNSGTEESGTVSEQSTSDVLEVYTTAYPLTYFTERIGGERVNVQSIYPPGANEHSFEPTQQDMIALAEADFLFYIGLGLEEFIDSAESTLEDENVEFISTADAISDEELESGQLTEEDNHEGESAEEDSHEGESAEEDSHEDESAEEESHDEHGHDSVDPHVWISPVLSQKLAESIKDSLVQADAEGAELYEANFEELVSELQELDQSFIDLASEVENKTFFVSHDAFGYIANTYGFEQVAVAGLNSQDEPSQKELTEIVDLAKENQIEYVVFEQNVSSQLTEIIQNEIGAESVNLHNLGVLTEEDIANDETYFTLMEKNREVLKLILE